MLNWVKCVIRICTSFVCFFSGVFGVFFFLYFFFIAFETLHGVHANLNIAVEFIHKCVVRAWTWCTGRSTHMWCVCVCLWARHVSCTLLACRILWPHVLLSCYRSAYAVLRCAQTNLLTYDCQCYVDSIFITRHSTRMTFTWCNWRGFRQCWRLAGNVFVALDYENEKYTASNNLAYIFDCEKTICDLVERGIFAVLRNESTIRLNRFLIARNSKCYPLSACSSCTRSALLYFEIFKWNLPMFQYFSSTIAELLGPI